MPTRMPPKAKPSQQRYRTQKRQKLERLEHDVQQLQRHIARCEGQLEVLRTSVCSHDGPLRTAADFFSHFRHGYQVHRPDLRQQQDAFLCSVMQPDLLIMNERSLEKLFAQWRLYYHLFPAFEMEILALDVLVCDETRLVRAPPDLLIMNERSLEKLFAQWQLYYHLFPAFEMEILALDVLVCDETRLVRAPVTLHLRLSRYSLQCLCPHILQDEWLVQRLVGQVLSVPTMIHFHFRSDGAIDQMETATDIAAALVSLLGSTDEALVVADGAQMNSSGELTQVQRGFVWAFAKQWNP
ncbi:hypothetical protein SDRG_10377 [Saprolegnia diclina VS20]|uniref:BZIP domain-containing protein n=1 Tax=Saprolegnia diclina (strain VS20) TaxID=1156394 RepID=T0Q2W2_SAPDV|nr:hypothetical protein SDRG_10377 [Saprolegnia diclina VS20]EQC32184.1 hypothetical protein SDRG_10377 [Saprolegnia diclina VS20]|eukprot:XP_008614586.1 hypothetical protein SDRG_10377 [Saprolegnia diclina VS20]